MRQQKSMIPKKPAPDLIRGGTRFSEKIMLPQKRMIPKSGTRFSEKIMLPQKRMIPKKPAPDSIRGGTRFSEKIMRRQNVGAAR